MSERTDVVLADLLQKKGYIRGPFGSALKRPEMKSEGIPVYEQQHAIYNSREFRFFIDDEKFEELKRFQVKTNDLVISCSGTVGKVTIIREEDPKGIISQALLILRADSAKVLPEYLKYFFTSKKGYNAIVSRSSGSVQVNISKREVIEQIPLSLPSISEQEKIVSVLKNIDDKIENNNQINRNLSEQAQAVFNSWFVKFECFDEPMKESPIGTKIPMSIDLIQIGDLNPVLETGRRPKGGAVTEGIPSLGAESVKGIGNYSVGSAKYIPVDFAAKLKTGKVNGYELMIYKDGGRPGTFEPHFSMFGEGYPFEEFYINEHVFKLDFGDRGYNEFAYYYFQTDYVMNWLESNGGKAAIPGINQSVVNDIWIIKPDHPKVKEYCNWVQPLFTQILKNCYSNMKLGELRDSLLPKLMSGELDVVDLNI